MKCKECACCRLGYFKDRPGDYVCVGVKHPFVVEDTNRECTEYPTLALKSRSVEFNNEKSYDNLLQSLNAVKWELKKRNDPSLDHVIKYIKNAVFEACRMNDRLTTLESVCANRGGQDDWWGD